MIGFTTDQETTMRELSNPRVVGQSAGMPIVRANGEDLALTPKRLSPDKAKKTKTVPGVLRAFRGQVERFDGSGRPL